MAALGPDPLLSPRLAQVAPLEEVMVLKLHPRRRQALTMPHLAQGMPLLPRMTQLQLPLPPWSLPRRHAHAHKCA